MAVEETVGQRFTQLISYLGISKNAFAASLDKTATVIQHLVDERNKPGFDLLCKVFEIYPNVSKDWLLQGTGPMLYATPSSTPVAPMVAPTEVPVQAVEEKKPDVSPSKIEETPISSQPLPTPQPAAPNPVSSEPVTPPVPTPPIAAEIPAMAPATASAATASDTSWQTALYTQQMAHQLALAELRNQHLQEQQRLMQQMMDLMQRQLAR
ncbi:hypothetical protein [Hymenobacter mucosus]|uniref:HTH cro/C1-type domain-containing protein n=1 Tax=Hymenobacter mucosus TaxID=1411120 RepID=A0A238V2C5_9BACT|nr:hypothetical protein [Hymenobacter mucosus]SNR28692.1 hypothetical protein SAMN06269173_10135 [Hymenobacter mucosus]